MKIEIVRVIEHLAVTDAYKMITLYAPSIAAAVKPGQFVHLLVPKLEGSVLRRPFSVFNASNDTISIIYKQVGRGTTAMTSLAARNNVSIMGPLGNGFPLETGDRIPILVAGGYGVAPLSFLASRLKTRGIACIGAKSKADLLCIDMFRKLGWEVKITTEDGSAGSKGLVTDAIANVINEISGRTPEFFACGPDAMMKAVAGLVKGRKWRAWLSLDKHMGCGVGACLACVQRIRAENGTETWKRVCKDGPVFESREVIWRGKE